MTTKRDDGAEEPNGNGNSVIRSNGRSLTISTNMLLAGLAMLGGATLTKTFNLASADDLAAVKADVAEVKVDVADVKADVAEIDEKVGSLTHSANSGKLELDYLKRDVDGLRAEVETLKRATGGGK